MKIPEIRFLLKERNSKNATLIYMVARYENIKLVYSTGLKILPDLWDFETQRPTKNKSISKSFPNEKNEIKDYDILINKYKIKLEELFRTYMIKGEVPSANKIKEELDKNFKKKIISNKKIDFFKFIENYIEATNKKPVTKKGYKTTLNHLHKFQDKNKHRLNFETIDLDFYDEFVKYFQDQNYSKNTIGVNVKNVKVFMEEATERGLNSNMNYRNKRFKVLKETTDQIYLNEAEIRKIYELDLSDKPRLDNVKDIFVAACYTGLRFSDLDQIRIENIVESKLGRLLKVKTQKTDEEVIIPLNQIVERILQKREGKLPKIMSNQKLNSYIKELGKLAELTENIPITKTKGGLRINSSIQKYKLISVHTARRSFSSNAYLAGVPVIAIMKITGHKTEKAFMTYIRITKEQNAEKLLSHPFFQSKTNLKIS